ncbi:MAG TPA: DUF362 domain-containing protein [Candidatus Brocadiia bacterium]|nr:DUF362 domain-containing protein [Candidatus Brocadiia bacterium]
MSANMDNSISRRRFMAQAAAAGAAVLAGGALIAAEPAPPSGPAVVIVRDASRKSIEGMKPDAVIVKKLVDRAVMNLAEKDNVAAAWGRFVSKKDKVAIKFNGLCPNATTHPEVILAVADGILQAGVDPANVIIFDRQTKDVATVRLKENREGMEPRIYGTDGSYGAACKTGPIETQLSRILEEADVLVNVPFMKSHVQAGVSGALKNHLGTVPNAAAFHVEDCAYIADINALPQVKDKTRICILDAIYGLFDGGPDFNAKSRWDYHGILASADPVALDTVMEDIIRARRLEEKLTPRNNSIIHITRAAELGLGCADLAGIRRLETEI